MRFLEKHFSYTRCFVFLITYVQHFKVKKIKLGAILFLGGKLYPPIYGFLLSKNRGMKHKKNLKFLLDEVLHKDEFFRKTFESRKKGENFLQLFLQKISCLFTMMM